MTTDFSQWQIGQGIRWNGDVLEQCYVRATTPDAAKPNFEVEWRPVPSVENPTKQIVEITLLDLARAHTDTRGRAYDIDWKNQHGH